MSKRRVAQIVRKRNRFRQILVQAQRAGDSTTDRRNLDGMRQASAQVVARPVEKNLGLVFHAAERARMNDACAVPLKLCPIGVARLGVLTPARFTGFFSKWREHCALSPLP